MKDSIKREQRQAVLHFAEREDQRSLAGGKSNSRAKLKKKIFLLFALLCVVAQGAWAQVTFPIVYDDVWDGVTTTRPAESDGFVMINRASDLAYIRDHWEEKAGDDRNYCYQKFSLNANLDMNWTVSWTPLGKKEGEEFSGKFYGNNHTIRIHLWGTDDNEQGLFWQIYDKGEVHDLHLTGKIEVGNARCVGGIAATSYGIIQNCWVSADISSTHYNSSTDADLGGIAGINTILGTATNYHKIEYCCMTGNVSNPQNSDVGGIVGYNVSKVDYVTFYGTRTNNHSQYSIWIGKMATDNTATLGHAKSADDLVSDDALNTYLASVPTDYALYRQALQYPYAVNVTNTDFGAVVSNIARTRPGQTVRLTKTSGTLARIDIKDADGNNVSVSGNENEGWTFTMPRRDVNINAYFWADWPTQGAGTPESPYIIGSADDWDKFAHNVRYGRTYSGSHVKLTADISVSTMAGSSTDNSFQGIFDGDGHTLTFNQSGFTENFIAPFRYVGSCTIKNLKTAGSIKTSQQFASGLISYISAYGSTVTVENCISSMTLNSSLDYNSSNGGLIAAIANNCTVTVSGCAFTGSFAGASSDNNGGIVSWVNDGTTLNITDCLFAPASISTELDGCNTWARGAGATLNNCYYTETYGTPQGREASTPTSDPGNLGNLVKDYGLVKAYENGIFLNGKYCVAPSAATIIQPEDEWDAVCWQTHTAQADWTAINSGSTTGCTIGSAGNTTYYYITQNLTFSNSNAGGSGLTVLGTVYLYIPSGLQLTSTGANASGQTGGGAGVELTSGNTLYLLGSGTLNATGGKAANGGAGGTGGNATGYNGDWTETGTGGNGGYGGGGAGAGIGTKGGAGGNGGSGGSGYHYTDWKYHNGTDGTAGSAGATAGAMGDIYVYRAYQQTAAVTVNATGGAAGSTGGSSGQRGRGYAWDGYSYNYTVAGGGGGGGGGFGGAASSIGTGGPGGGGGGGGAGGAQDYRSNSSGGVYDVTAYGGKGGKNANGSSAADGIEAATTGTATNEGWVTVDNGSFGDDWNPASGDVTFGNSGSGGGKGNASIAGTVQRLWGSLVLGSGTETNPYQIQSTADFDQLASNVNGGTTYENRYFVLINDISVETKCGTVSGDVQGNAFSGTFDGGSNTITATITDNDNQGTALFCYINGATIKNLTVAGTITGTTHTAAIVGFADGTSIIRNCVATATVSGGTHIGGILGHGLSGDISISGCAYSGLMTGGGTAKGAIFGWGNDGGTKSVTDCLYLMADGQNTTGLDLVRGYGTVTVSNCYKTTGAGSYGTKAYALAAAPANLGAAGTNYGMVKAYANGILFGGTYYVAPASISLANGNNDDPADNTTAITGANGYVADVTLAGRTLYKDGAWNTICLPFNVTLTGSPLEGATARTLTSASISGTTLNLTFGDAVDELEAGTPYIIKWASGANLTEADLVFSGVTIDDTDRSYDNGEGGDLRVRFIGTYKSTSFDATDNTVLLLGGENTLYYPTDGAGLGAQRAYFKLGDGAALARKMTSFNIDFGDESTGIVTISKESGSEGVATGWYTLDGMKLSQKPTAKGIYVNNGRKVVVK